MKTLTRKCFIPISLALLLAGCTAPSQLILALDGVSIAANAAAPFAGQYAPYVAAVATFAKATAATLQTNPTITSGTLLQILQNAESIATPELTGASPQQQALIGAIEAAFNGFVALLRTHADNSRFMPRTAVVYQLTKADLKKLADTQVKATAALNNIK
jgi:hypothetical protein